MNSEKKSIQFLIAGLVLITLSLVWLFIGPRISAAMPFLGSFLGSEADSTRPFIGWLLGISFWLSILIGMLFLMMMSPVQVGKKKI